MAELTALAEAMSKAIDTLTPIPQHRRPVTHFFIDSIYTINMARGRWIARSSRRLITLVRDLLRSLELLTAVHFHWVPGHAEIFGNEVADWLAKRGATGITSTNAPPPEILTSLRNGVAVRKPQPTPPPRASPPDAKECRPGPATRATIAQPHRYSLRKRKASPLFPDIDFSMSRVTTKRSRTTLRRQDPGSPPRPAVVVASRAPQFDPDPYDEGHDLGMDPYIALSRHNPDIDLPISASSLASNIILDHYELSDSFGCAVDDDSSSVDLTHVDLDLDIDLD